MAKEDPLLQVRITVRWLTFVYLKYLSRDPTILP
jgi:hypothetical protein